MDHLQKNKEKNIKMIYLSQRTRQRLLLHVFQWLVIFLVKILLALIIQVVLLHEHDQES